MLRSTALTAIVLVTAATCLPAGTEQNDAKSPAAKAFELRMVGKVDGAREILEAALAKDPKDGAVHFELARVNFYSFDFDGALSEIERAAKLKPDSSHYQYWAGLTASYKAIAKAHDPNTRDQVNGLLKKSLEFYRKAVKLDPKNHEARLQLVNLYLKNPSDSGGSRAEAEKSTKELEALDAVYGAKARALLLGETAYDKQRPLWEKVVASHPDSAGAHEGLGTVYLRLKNTDKAVSHLNKALQLDKTRSEILVDLTRHFALAKEYSKAEKTVQRYLEYKPAPPVPMRAYATFLAAKIQKIQGHDDRAEKLLTDAKKLDSRVWQTFMQPARPLFDAP